MSLEFFKSTRIKSFIVGCIFLMAGGYYGEDLLGGIGCGFMSLSIADYFLLREKK